jgi:hypothetical protein
MDDIGALELEQSIPGGVDGLSQQSTYFPSQNSHCPSMAAATDYDSLHIKAPNDDSNFFDILLTSRPRPEYRLLQTKWPGHEINPPNPILHQAAQNRQETSITGTWKKERKIWACMF